MQTLPTDIAAAATATDLDVVLLAEYGSRAHGTSTDASDHDLLGVYVERDHQLYGLEGADTENYRVLANGDLVRLGVGEKTARSGADDIELHFHPLRKYVSLAARGNPTVLSAMWAYDHHAAVQTTAAELLVAHRDAFLSKHAGFRHAGYARQQRDALLGLTNKRTNRPELISLHGYDTKYAAHLIRLLYAGLDLVRDRTFHLPMKPEQIEFLQEIRRGEIPLEDILVLSEKLEHELTTETEDSDLPDSADYEVINTLLRNVRNAHLRR